MSNERSPGLQAPHLIWHLVKRGFQVRYSGSLLGFVWSLAIPLSQLLIISFVFGSVLSLGTPNFPLFVLTGLLPWGWFSSSLTAAGSTFTESRDLLRHPGFDPAVLVVVMVLSNLMTFLLSLPVLLGMLYWYDLGLLWYFPLAFALLVLIQGLLIAGLSLIIATANVFYRDVSHLVGLVVFLMLFITPIWYSAPKAGPYRMIFEINPMSHIVENYRRLLIDQSGLDWPGLLIATSIAAFFLVVGFWVYRRMESDVVDAI